MRINLALLLAIFAILTACRPANATPKTTSVASETIATETSPATPTNVHVVLVTNTPTAWPSPTAGTTTPTATSPSLATRRQPPMPHQSATPTPVSTPTPTPPAAPSGMVTGDIVNVRRAPSTAADILGTVTVSQTVTIVGHSVNGDWWQIDDPLAGWVSAEFVDTAPTIVAVPEVSVPIPTPITPVLIVSDTVTNSITGVVTGDLLNVRSGPGTEYEIVGGATLSQTVQIVGENDTGNWYQVCCLANSSEPGWLAAEFVDTPSTADIPVLAKANPSTPKPAAALMVETGTTASPPADENTLPPDGGWGLPTNTNPLTGASLTAASLSRPVIVCINNDPKARPQYGIGAADVMYEYIMEGYSITRFSGIFFATPPVRIGPVRSARLVNYYLGALYNAPLFCSGASDKVRFMLKNSVPFPYLDVDLDDPSNRLYSDSIGNDYRTRLNTSTDGLKKWLSNWDIETPGGLRGFTLGEAPGGGEPATSVEIAYPAVTGSNVRYAFDAASGTYLRFLGDDPHLDANTGVQVSVANVVVQVVPHEETEMVEDSLGNTGIRLNLFGSGEAIVFRDGQAFVGTWRSDNRGDTPHFYAADGSEISLKPGHTWVSIVPTLNDVSFGD